MDDVKRKYLDAVEREVATLSKIFEIIYNEFKEEAVELDTLVLDFQSFQTIFGQSREGVKVLEERGRGDEDLWKAAQVHRAVLVDMEDRNEEIRTAIKAGLLARERKGKYN